MRKALKVQTCGQPTSKKLLRHANNISCQSKSAQTDLYIAFTLTPVFFESCKAD